MINTENLDPDKIKIDEKSFENILIYHIRYVTVKYLSSTKINRANPLYLIINKTNEYMKKAMQMNI